MFLQILFIIFIIVSFINILHFGLYLVGANYYDIKKFRAKSKVIKRKKGLRPLVSVLIPAHNEGSGVIKTIESVRKNTHRKLEIIVINDGSTDNTAKLVKQYICMHPNRSISLINLRKNVGKASALNKALRRQAQGSLIMTLDSDSILDRKSISNAVKYFDNPKVVGVAANVQIIDNFKLLGLLQMFEYMIGYRSKKFYSESNSEFIIGGVGSTFRAEIIKKVGLYDTNIITEDIALSLKIAAEGNKDNRLVYGVDVLAKTEAVGTFKSLLSQRFRWKMGILQSLIKHRKMLINTNRKYSRTLTLYRIPMAFLGELLILLEPLAIGFVVYLIVKSGSLSLWVGTYMTITAYILWNVWPDENIALSRKLKLSLYAPIMYFILYIMNIVQLSAIIKCLFNPKQVLLKTKTLSSWVSPERALQPNPVNN